MEYQGIIELRKFLNNKKRYRILERYKYYDMKNATKYLKGAIPSELMWMKSVMGWCTKSVDTLENRLVFRGFDNDKFDMNSIFALNNPDVLYSSAIISALICSCSFIFLENGAEGPELQVVDGGDATGVFDKKTGMLIEGYAVLERDLTTKLPVEEVYTVAGRTDYYHNNQLVKSVDNDLPYAALVPIVFRPDAVRPFGHSRISRAAMSYTQGALRTIMRSEIAAEFYAFPQKYILGLSSDADELDNWRATIASILRIDKDEDGDKPTVGQFSTSSMTPYLDQLKTFASLMAGEASLTMDDLGFASDNPSSSEAIKATHENLRLIARKAQRTFGTGFLNTGYLAACMRDEYTYKRNEIYNAVAEWEPIFEPDMSALSLIGDGVIKLNQALPGYIGNKNLRRLTGIEPDEGIDGRVINTGSTDI
jgi:hypothetical protein